MGVTYDAPDPLALARFYRDLLGPQWTIKVEEPEPSWVELRPEGGGVSLSFQAEPAHVRPTWPAGPGDQQMKVHLDIAVAYGSDVDLAAEVI